MQIVHRSEAWVTPWLQMEYGEWVEPVPFEPALCSSPVSSGKRGDGSDTSWQRLLGSVVGG